MHTTETTRFRRMGQWVNGVEEGGGAMIVVARQWTGDGGALRMLSSFVQSHSHDCRARTVHSPLM